jgi:hypothetical protein
MQIKVALQVQFSAGEVADYIFREDVISYWLGSDAHLALSIHTKAYLPHFTGTAASGEIVDMAWPAKNQSSVPAGIYELIVNLDGTPETTQVTQVAIRISPLPDGSCRLRIQQTGLTDHDQCQASLKIWQGALRRLERLMNKCMQNLRHERQAVIVVHGIGEQRPGQMLRDFVSNVFDQGAGEIQFVKPDYISPLYELRTISVPRDNASRHARPTTDIYELYWADLILDTTFTQAYSWILKLAFSKDRRISKSILPLVWAIRSLLILVFLAFAWLMSMDISGLLKTLGGGFLLSIPAIVSFGFKYLRSKFIVGYLGDAARYLEPNPENIAIRQKVRQTGTQLLDDIHKKGRYSRIIVYGHSLGSVIAYDILSLLWARHSRDRDPDANTSSRALIALEDQLNPRAGQVTTSSIRNIQEMQNEAWHEYRRNGFTWLVSDFVTSGSPLAHAHWLLNLDAKTDFEDLVRERSFPTCPPQTELQKTPVPYLKRQAFTFTHAYQDQTDSRKKRSVQVPNHGGLFALTRWTNLYFPHKGFINGDPVAGQLGGLFGHWIRDVRLRQTNRFSHCNYTDRTLEADAVAEVRAALNLSLCRPLSDYAPKNLVSFVQN